MKLFDGKIETSKMLGMGLVLVGIFLGLTAYFSSGTVATDNGQVAHLVSMNTREVCATLSCGCCILGFLVYRFGNSTTGQ